MSRALRPPGMCALLASAVGVFVAGREEGPSANFGEFLSGVCACATFATCAAES